MPNLIDRHHTTLKLMFVGALSLAMLIPLMMVRGIISERQGMQLEARSRISERWGGTQTLSGLVALSEPSIRVTDPRGTGNRTARRARVLPEIDIDAHLSTEWRYLGIYDAPVYTADLTLSGVIDWDVLDDFQPAGDLVFWLPLSDVRGMREISVLKLAGQSLPARPLSVAADAAGTPVSGLQFTVPEEWRQTLFAAKDNRNGHDPDVTADALGGARRIRYRLELRLAGSGCLLFLPLADTTDVTLEADWPHPEFVGQFLPIERSIGEHTTAHWSLLGLNRPFGDEWLLSDASQTQLNQATFGLRLETPADGYQRSERSVKYGFLFITLTFFTLFLFEVMTGRPLHPVPYVLTGAALTVFYLVLLALSEYLAFPVAYAAAAGLLVCIVALYTGVVLGRRGRGALVGMMMGVTYGLLYVLVSAKHAALLVGSLALLSAIAGLMFLTRKVDWYAYGTFESLRK